MNSENFVMSRLNIDELGRNYAKWNKPGTESQVPNNIEAKSEMMVSRGWEYAGQRI
jgi:hypothetical protein